MKNLVPFQGYHHLFYKIVWLINVNLRTVLSNETCMNLPRKNKDFQTLLGLPWQG
jgi:hypothetical protein